MNMNHYLFRFSVNIQILKFVVGTFVWSQNLGNLIIWLIQPNRQPSEVFCFCNAPNGAWGHAESPAKLQHSRNAAASNSGGTFSTLQWNWASFPETCWWLHWSTSVVWSKSISSWWGCSDYNENFKHYEYHKPGSNDSFNYNREWPCFYFSAFRQSDLIKEKGAIFEPWVNENNYYNAAVWWGHYKMTDGLREIGDQGSKKMFFKTRFW